MDTGELDGLVREDLVPVAAHFGRVVALEAAYAIAGWLGVAQSAGRVRQSSLHSIRTVILSHGWLNLDCSYYGNYGSCIRCQRMPKVSKGIFEVGKPTRLRTRLCVARVTMYVVHS